MEGNKILAKLINTYHFKRDPVFISNNDIFNFFIKNSAIITYNDFLEIKKYFTDFLGAHRRCFTEIEKWYNGSDKDTKVSVIDGSFVVPRPRPRMLKEFIEFLRMKRYSPKTFELYVHALKAVNDWCVSNRGNIIDDVTGGEIYEYFKYLINDKKVSSSTIRIHRFAVACYFTKVLNIEIDLTYAEGLKDSKNLPVILSREEIQQVLDAIHNLKHRTMLALMYSSGLRLSELVSLRVRDINMGELTIHIKEGKGRKDRITVFSDKIRGEIARFMQGKEPGDYLFQSSMGDGRGGHRHLSGRTVQKVLENALKRAGINKKATPHDLRHSFATHLLENGISLRHIQHLLGHKNISTTTIYTSVSNPHIKGIKSPL